MTPASFTADSFKLKRGPVSPFFVFLGFFWNDVINYSVKTPLGSSLMLADVFFFASVFFAVKDLRVFINRKSIMVFYAIMLLYVLIGMLGFGMKALSDCRQYYHFFFLFLGYRYAANISEDELVPAIYRIIFSIALGGFILFLIEMAVGHSIGLAIMNAEEAEFGMLEDERGIRILGATETYNLCLLFVFYYFMKGAKGLVLAGPLSLVYLIAALITQNRTPIIACFLGVAAVSVLPFRIRKGRLHMVFLNIALLLIAFLVIYELDRQEIFPLFSSLKSALSVENDEIGTSGFRLLGALGGLEVFLRNILFGEGLGGGWNIDFGFAVLNIPPHNQYVSILAKFGLLGFTAFLAWMFAGRKIVRQFAKLEEGNKQLVRFSSFVIMSQIPYGFGFDFHPFLPFYLGILLARVARKQKVNEEEGSLYYSHV